VAKQRATTWAQVGVKNAGIRETTRALHFAMGWGLATAELGREPRTVEEYATVMEVSRATAFRDQQAFRDAFPDEETPLNMNQASGVQERYDEIWARLRDRAKARRELQPLLFTLGAATAE
jgi:hypothetical protein